MLGSSERERVIWVRTNERSLSKGSARLRVAKTIETGAAPDRRLPGECDQASLSRAFLKAAGMRGSKALEMVERRDSLITRPTILRIRDTGNGLEIITGKSINRRRSSPRRCPMPHCPPRGGGDTGMLFSRSSSSSAEFCLETGGFHADFWVLRRLACAERDGEFFRLPIASEVVVVLLGVTRKCGRSLVHEDRHPALKSWIRSSNAWEQAVW